MKKKATSKTAAPKTSRKTTKYTSSASQTILVHRIFIISAVLTLFVVGAFWMNKQAVTQSVLGTTVMKGMYGQATIEIPLDVPKAASYNIYYKLASEDTFSNSIRNISPAAGTYTISYLKKGEDYVYRFVAVDDKNTEFLFSETLPITSIESME